MTIRRTLIQQVMCETSMTLELELANYLSFSWTLFTLLYYSESDIRNRSVSNRVTIPLLVLGVISVLMTGHLFAYLLLHVIALVFMTLLTLVLYRIGAIGGADFKTLLTVAILSPGVEFGAWGEPFIEAVIAGGLELFIMLGLGQLYWMRYRNHNENKTKPPLIPFLLVGYILVQLLMLF